MDGRYYLPTRKAGKAVISGVNEEVDLNVEVFLNSVKKSKVIHEKAAVNVSTGLEIGGRYHVTQVRELKTKSGRKQLWRMVGIVTGEEILIWAPKTLSNIIGTDGNVCVIDNKKENILLNYITVIYRGSEGRGNDISPSYIFEYERRYNV